MKTVNHLLLFILVAFLAKCGFSNSVTEKYTVKIKATVDGAAAVDAQIALNWDVYEGKLKPRAAVTTGDDGQATYELDNWNRKRQLMVVDKESRLAAILKAGKEDDGKTFDLELKPLVHVKFKLECPDLDSIQWANVIVAQGDRRSDSLQQCQTTKNEFELFLPPDDYYLMIYGGDLEKTFRKISVPEKLDEGQTYFDLGTFDVRASGMARLTGKPAPDLILKEATGLNVDFKISDLKGKWVLLEFWGYW